MSQKRKAAPGKSRRTGQARKRPRPGKTLVESPAAPLGSLVLRSSGGASYLVSLPSDFKREAQYWDHVLRNRIRWIQDENALQAVKARCTEFLNQLGLDAQRLQEIVDSGVVEIDIPYHSEASDWELRIFPWEFLLFIATADKRRVPLIVVRHVCCSDDEAAWRAPKKCMVVGSAPGALDVYSFDSERRLVESNLRLPEVAWVPNPTLEELTSEIKVDKPDVVHLAGIDSHQGKQILGIPEGNGWDGYFLSDEKGTPVAVNAEDLAPALRGVGTAASKGHRPLLVSCNFYNSAARIAAIIAAESAMAAIGFQDEIDDGIAENFFARFYFNWRTLDWDLLRAYRATIGEVHLAGAVVVLWSVRSLLADVRNKSLLADTKQVRAVRNEPAAQEVASMDVRKVLDVKVKLRETVNYSLLQNDEDVFEQFSISKLVDGKITGIRVQVTLFVGSDSFPYEEVFDMEIPKREMAEDIRFPLTSNLLRSIRESVNTVISMKVDWKEQTRLLQTKPVKLLAIDEWVDTPALDAYLPSFVFPRDRAVAKIIDSAQRYLMSLNDDSGAGFDGYQGVDPRLKDPFVTVDLQAHAIWSALSYDLPLSYINPPPTFSASSQRLRTPSDVIDGRRGTCIDLALLLAACLEYVGIYPVIFLLKDHAFPGYWRSDEAQQKFIDMSPKTSMTSEKEVHQSAFSVTPGKPWVFTNFSEVVQLTRAGDLVPIETVWLTQHEGFWNAVDEGMNDLRSRQEFSSMIDIQYARSQKKPVTPLPILALTS